jgi:hypothetical protein
MPIIVGSPNQPSAFYGGAFVQRDLSDAEVAATSRRLAERAGIAP